MLTDAGPARLSRAVRVAGLVLIVLAGLLYALCRRDSGVVGSNGVRPLAFVGKLDAGDELCQPLGMASRPPTSVRLTLGVAGAGPQPLRTRVRGQGPVRVTRDYRDGVVSFQLPTLRAKTEAVFCLLNRGTRPVSVAGEAVSEARIDDHAAPYAASFTLVAGRRRWRNRAGEIFQRTGLARGELSGVLSVAALLGCVLCTCVVTVGATWRHIR